MQVCKGFVACHRSSPGTPHSHLVQAEENTISYIRAPFNLFQTTHTPEYTGARGLLYHMVATVIGMRPTDIKNDIGVKVYVHVYATLVICTMSYMSSTPGRTRR